MEICRILDSLKACLSKTIYLKMKTTSIEMYSTAEYAINSKSIHFLAHYLQKPSVRMNCWKVAIARNEDMLKNLDFLLSWSTKPFLSVFHPF